MSGPPTAAGCKASIGHLPTLTPAIASNSPPSPLSPLADDRPFTLSYNPLSMRAYRLLVYQVCPMSRARVPQYGGGGFAAGSIPVDGGDDSVTADGVVLRGDNERQ